MKVPREYFHRADFKIISDGCIFIWKRVPNRTVNGEDAFNETQCSQFIREQGGVFQSAFSFLFISRCVDVI